jgi:hypothetical protein
MTIATLDVSNMPDITFTHHQYPRSSAIVRLDLYQDDDALGSLTLSHEQALELRATLNEWAPFYGIEGVGTNDHS